MQQNSRIVKAVVGILRNADGEILIAERRPDQFMGGYWELPGGKIEDGESNEVSLARELKEELGINISAPSLMHTMCHHYEEKTVYLWIYTIDAFDGEAGGAEGQNITWCTTQKLNDFSLLPTMKAIIHKICLPDRYWITPKNEPEKALLEQLQAHISSGAKLVQLRAKTALNPQFIKHFYEVCRASNTKLILNTIDKTFKEECDGWHLTTKELLLLNERPCAEDKLLGASTHNENEGKRAESIEADYISIAPVEVTKSHPYRAPLGWAKAEELVDKSNLPVYLLGGMSRQTLKRSLSIRAQGVAGISQI
ncbi:MAG: Nudix family hydrolase [Gammaproteobacteria bacterium]|nr:Nudix family hydrolase [Gammaproteobacteria bacterium]